MEIKAKNLTTPFRK